MREYKVKRTSVVIGIGIFSAVLAAVAGMCVALSQLGASEIYSSAYWGVRWLTPFVCSLLIPAVVNIFRAFRSYRVDSETARIGTTGITATFITKVQQSPITACALSSSREEGFFGVAEICLGKPQKLLLSVFYVFYLESSTQ